MSNKKYIIHVFGEKYLKFITIILKKLLTRIIFFHNFAVAYRLRSPDMGG